MKTKFLLVLVGCSFGASLIAADADLSTQLVGSWKFAATNAPVNRATQMMTTETHFRADGVFFVEGTIGMTYPTNENLKVLIKRDGVLVPREQAFTREISGSGIWRIEKGYLYTTITNSSSMETNVESKYEILSLTGQSFSYRTRLGQIRTESRKP